MILVLGSGGRLYREYLLAGAARRHDLWLLDGDEPTWQAPYVRGASTVPLLDRARLIPDVARLSDAAWTVAREHGADGVLSYDETLVVATARIAERLRLPGLGADGADRCRNKHRCRELLTAAGIAQPRFAVARTLAEARTAAAEIGYPVVLKPRGMGASIGVVRATCAAELGAAFATAERASHEGSPDYEGGVLVEQLLTGEEISVDGAVLAGGGYVPFCLAHKRIGLEPYFEELGHVVDAHDPLLRDRSLVEMLRAAHRTLGLGPGITHAEVKLTPRGPVIVEVNARLGGDLIPYVGKLATGIDPAAVAVALATGEAPPLEPALAGCVGVRFLYPPEDCEVLAIELPPDVLEARAMVKPGARLLLPPRAHLGRYAYAICASATRAECDARLDAAAAATRLQHRPI